MGIKVQEGRNVSLDVIRLSALFLVISVHFFLFNGFYDEAEVGGIMLLATIMRTMAMSCVPLFMILSGYLLSEKLANKKYFKGITKLLATYVLVSIVCFSFKAIVLKEVEFSFVGLIGGIFNFTAANYAWYVEMYIGLFLLAPFLNLIYKNLANKKQKMLLLGVLLLLTALPSVTNIFSVRMSGATILMDLKANQNLLKIMPSYWMNLYPITYYFIGSFLKEFPLKMKKYKVLVIYLLAAAGFGLFNYLKSYGGTFQPGMWQEYYSAFNVILSVLVFTFIYRKTNVKPKTEKIFAFLSQLCFGAYLLSFVADKIVNKVLLNCPMGMKYRLKYFPIIVILEFVVSILMSWLIKIVQDTLTKVVRTFGRKS